MKLDIHIHIHHHSETKTINLKLDKIMSKATDIEAKVDALQTTLDEEQAQIRLSIDGLTTTIQELRDQIAGGGADEEALDRILNKLDGIKSDLEGTIADAPQDPPTDTPVG